MIRVPVQSSDLASVGYDPVTRILEVEFVKTGVYSYLSVPPEVYAELMAAPSKGRYFNLAIKNGPYPYEKGTAESLMLEGGMIPPLRL